jgi:uncharacterized membrane protein HdeD (DUF308 family)
MNKNNFLFGILVAIFGLVMIIRPDFVVVAVAITIGICVAADGVFILASVRSVLEDERFRIITTVRAWFYIVVGVFAIAMPLVFAGVMWTAMVYMLAASLLVAAGIETYGLIQLRESRISLKPFVMEIIYSILIAIVLFIIPAKSFGRIIIYICGGVLIVGGIIFAIYEWKHRDLVVRAESVDDDSSSADATTAETKTKFGREEK